MGYSLAIQQNDFSKINHYQKGINAEINAQNKLSYQGYHILGRRIKNRYGEIDILARKNQDMFVFEVKARKNFTTAFEAISQKQLSRSANAFFDYAEKNNLTYEGIYFKAVAVVGNCIEIRDINTWEE